MEAVDEPDQLNCPPRRIPLAKVKQGFAAWRRRARMRNELINSVTRICRTLARPAARRIRDSQAVLDAPMRRQCS